MLNKKLRLSTNGVILGHGLVAQEDIQAGEVVWFPGEDTDIVSSAELRELRKQGSKAFYSQLDDDLFVENEHDEWFWSHSCDPNCVLKEGRLLASKRICRGEEVTYDYGVTELGTRWQFWCACGSAQCRRFISNKDYLNKALRLRTGENLPDHALLAVQRSSTGQLIKYQAMMFAYRCRFALFGSRPLPLFIRRLARPNPRWLNKAGFWMKNLRPFTYRAFDVVVKSNVELPELEHCNGASADITLIVWLPAMQVGDYSWFHHWYSDDEKSKIAFSIARDGDEYRLRFPALADFIVRDDGRMVICEPTDQSTAETNRHLFLDQVLPRILGHWGSLVLHASAVELVGGVGIAFAGNSGWGKSTLASSFRQEGVRFLGDDCLKIKVIDGELVGISAYSGSRLWEDSISTIYPEGVDSASVSQYSSKRRVMANQGESQYETRLKAVFFLNDPQAPVDGVGIEALQGVSTVMDIIRRSFLLDIGNAQAAGKQFKVIQDMLATQPVFYSLGYPREFSRLQKVRDAVVSRVLSEVMD